MRSRQWTCLWPTETFNFIEVITWTWILVLRITWSWNLCHDAHCASFCTVIHGHPTSNVGFRPGNAMQARLFMQSLVLPLNSCKLISSSIGLDNSVRCIWDNMGSRFDWQHAVAPNLLCLNERLQPRLATTREQQIHGFAHRPCHSPWLMPPDLKSEIWFTRVMMMIIIIRRPGSACTVFFSYVASKILSQGAHPKSPVQNPKSKIPKIQNPKSPKSKIQNPKSPKSKIQNPQIPKSKLCT